METLFWTSALLLTYVYAGYPLLLLIWSTAAGRPVRKRPLSGHRDWPAVSVIIAAHNEADRLHARIVNLLEQRYPGWLEIIVASDGSTDDTRGALEGFDDRLQLLELPRGGKAFALNAGVAASRGEILVFADARQQWAGGAILELAANFHDPDVGGVTGELILRAELDADAPDAPPGEGIGLYWKYEKWLRRHESQVWSTNGATGAIYALRRSVWQPLPQTTLLDDVLAPMRAVLAGKRIVFEARARAFDPALPNCADESRRKTRTLAGNYQILALEPRLLLPVVNPIWLQYASHKIGRLVAPWALMGTLVASALLAADWWLYAVALIVQLSFYGLAAVGGWIESSDRNDAISGQGPPTVRPGPAVVTRRTISHAAGGTRVKAS